MNASTGDRRLRVLVAVPGGARTAAITLHTARLGHTARIVADGDAALSRMRNEAIDVLLLDLALRGVSGHEVLRRKSVDPDLVPIATVLVSDDDSAVEACASLPSANIIARIRDAADASQLGRALEFARLWLNAESAPDG